MACTLKEENRIISVVLRRNLEFFVVSHDVDSKSLILSLQSKTSKVILHTVSVPTDVSQLRLFGSHVIGFTSNSSNRHPIWCLNFKNFTEDLDFSQFTILSNGIKFFRVIDSDDLKDAQF